MAIPANRIGDDDVPHCSPMVRAEGAMCVFVNGIPWSRLTDRNTPHLKPVPGIPPCIIHQAPIVKASKTVLPQKLLAGRIGDLIAECTATAKGSKDVFAG